MPHTEIYFKTTCPYSQAALSLLRRKGVKFTPIDVTHNAHDLVLEMRTRSGRTTVPQVFVDGQHLGGYDDIAALDAAGELDALLYGNTDLNAA